MIVYNPLFLGLGVILDSHDAMAVGLQRQDLNDDGILTIIQDYSGGWVDGNRTIHTHIYVSIPIFGKFLSWCCLDSFQLEVGHIR